MHTIFGIETEVEYRRRTYKREAEAEARAAQARPENERMRWSHWRCSVAARLRSLAAPLLALAPPHPSPIAMHDAQPGT
jgi:hypothetical protein